MRLYRRCGSSESSVWGCNHSSCFVHVPDLPPRRCIHARCLLTYYYDTNATRVPVKNCNKRLSVRSYNNNRCVLIGSTSEQAGPRQPGLVSRPELVSAPFLFFVRVGEQCKTPSDFAFSSFHQLFLI